jgi:hypothetical protein
MDGALPACTILHQTVLDHRNRIAGLIEQMMKTP